VFGIQIRRFTAIEGSRELRNPNLPRRYDRLALRTGIGHEQSNEVNDPTGISEPEVRNEQRRVWRYEQLVRLSKHRLKHVPNEGTRLLQR
jgi:hypothetical protein